MEKSLCDCVGDKTTSSSDSQTASVRDRLRVVSSASWRAARSRIGRVHDDLGIEARSTAYAAQCYAREKPWRVAGASALLALLVGYLIGARLRVRTDR